MVRLGLLVRLDAKPGKEEDVAALLEDALPLVDAEAATIAWFGVRTGPSAFAIFDVFADEAGRDDHLAGAVAKPWSPGIPRLLEVRGRPAA